MHKNVSFLSNQGYLLKGVLHLPSGKDSCPVAIIQHPFRYNHDDVLVKDLAVALEKSGVAVLRFTFSAHDPASGSYKNLLMSQFINDYKSAVNFLNKQPKLDCDRLGMAGQSMGAFASLMAVSELKTAVKAVVSVSAYYDLNHLFAGYVAQKKLEAEAQDYWQIKGHKIPKAHFKENYYMNMDKYLTKIDCPVLVIHGDKDKTVQVKDAYTIFDKLNEPKQLKIIKNGGHYFRSNQAQRQRVINMSVKWFKKYL